MKLDHVELEALAHRATKRIFDYIEHPKQHAPQKMAEVIILVALEQILEHHGIDLDLPQRSTVISP